ncbi:MAG: sensor histidine kinase [Novosphingobium sp.]
MAAALIALALVAALRTLIDIWLPNTAPYALAYPGLLIATLMGRLRGGLIAWVLIFGFLWWVGINHGTDFRFADPQDLPRTIINLVVGLIIVILTETARAGAVSLIAEREKRVVERDMLLAEFDHRLKNNLTILSSLIGMQAREAENPAVVEALGKTSARIASLGKTYDHLRYESGAITTVDLGQLMHSLCMSIHGSILAGSPIEFSCKPCPCLVERDRASALALLINELVTNAIKHAFIGRTTGKIDITLTMEGREALLSVEDDGVGIPTETPAGRQGMRLLNALAKMAQADLFVSSGPGGTRFDVRLRDLPRG